MVERKRKEGPSSQGPAADIPNVYHEMLADAIVVPDPSSPPRKRRRPGERASGVHPCQLSPKPPSNGNDGDVDHDEDEDLEFEDVAIPEPTVQTIYNDSDDEDAEIDDDERGMQFEDVNFAAPQSDNDQSKLTSDLELNLTAHQPAHSKRAFNKRKPISKAERERRIDIHKVHVLCLIIHCARRNRWCDDKEVQDALRPLLSHKTLSFLKPRASLTQLGKTESLKDGLQQIGHTFRNKFVITERGLRRCLWVEEPEHLANYELPSDLDSCINKAEFREAARTLRGSRDTGAQLLCALLRSAGLRARLVCSLQPLSASPGGPARQKSRETPKASSPATKASVAEILAQHEASPNAVGTPTARRRLGHPHAAAYRLPATSSPPPVTSPQKRSKPLRESPFPAYWVEVLDVAHQKWQPFDPLVTETMWRPGKLEPPASDRENCMSYVIAFESDGTMRDVTRRYAKAYAAKTRKLRVEAVAQEGEGWWRKALKPFARRWSTDLDQIESNELQALAAKEPMPRNLADFKDHPIYALERHLRRHEVFLPEAQPAGTIGAGSKGPLEKIYRRKDVRVARSRDKWYRLGREVKPMEIPVKFLPRRMNAKMGDHVDDGYGGDEREAAGTPVFMPQQTELFRHPPIKRGRVPKNKFGNIDLYVPSMVPTGGVYVADHDDEDRGLGSSAARAAWTLGIDYAPALTGFDFKGRQGTAVLNGVVVAAEYEEAVRAVLAGLEDVEAQHEANRRAAMALRTWRRFMVALRIRERIYAGVDPEERARDETKLAAEAGVRAVADEEADAAIEEEVDLDAPSETTEEYEMDDAEFGGGGFLVD